jgi:hypothetical protein
MSRKKSSGYILQPDVVVNHFHKKLAPVPKEECGVNTSIGN